jgi:NAD-reducing hydrogenase large subunit
VSHLTASAKACDNLLAVSIPPAAVKLRKAMNLAQLGQSHALSVFYLASPDILLGWDAQPEVRNVIGVAKAHAAIARDGIFLRSVGQQIIEIMGGKRIHPAWCVPGGVNKPLSPEDRDRILSLLPEAIARSNAALEWFAPLQEKFAEQARYLGTFPGLYMSLVDENGNLEHYDGSLRVVDDQGNLVVDRLDPRCYQSIIAEHDTEFSYMKSPYYKPLGYPDGQYRVGPLARLHIAKACGTPLADQWLGEFKKLDPRSSFHYHYARLIEMLYAYEKVQELISDPEILSDHVRAHADPNAFEGVGVTEAPRGTLIHHYKIDRYGLVTHADLIVATGHNNLAFNLGITQAAKHYVTDKHPTEGVLNRIEAVVRAYDPCFSCATHADGHLALSVEMIAPDGAVIERLQR